MSDSIAAGWAELLKDELSEDYFEELRVFLKQQYRLKTVYPPKTQVMNALKLTDYNDVKVVILGQDPYHGKGQAHGLAFSVLNGNPPPSLKNIYKELASDVGFTTPDHGNLTGWCNQGVLLLNTVLTVQEASPGSHKSKGWERFTDKIISLLNERSQPIVFMLWGKNAQEKRRLINADHHLVLTAAHPSPYSATAGFFGCRHFSMANKFLKNGIDWQL